MDFNNNCTLEGQGAIFLPGNIKIHLKNDFNGLEA